MRGAGEILIPKGGDKSGDLLVSLEEELLCTWLTHPTIESMFRKYGMDEPYFREHYGSALYRSFLTAAEGAPVEGSCAMIHTVVDYFKNRDIILTDLHHFFSIYRQSILKLLVQKEGFSIELFDEVQRILDRYFHEALLYYNASFFSKDQELKKELVRFREYQKVIDKSAIVSKTAPNGIITYVNQAFCQTSGYGCDELIGHPHSLIRHSDSDPELFKDLWRTVKAKKVFRATIKNRKKNGDTYYIDSTIVPILDEENVIIEFISMSYDVTALIEAVENAKIAQRAKDEFLANMSHEIRTPLNAITGFIAMLRKQVTDEKGQHYLDVIRSSSKMLLDIVNDILDLSKMQSGKFSIASEPFDPIAELSTCLALFASKSGEKSIRYAVYIDPKMPKYLRGDASRIKQVLSNFLSNAMKFTPEKGTVKVKANYEQGELRVVVQDSGIGVNVQKQTKIFEAFEQADSTITRNFGGTGLGLSISSQLISRMEGKIVFRSVEHKGSMFGFHLPLQECSEGEPEADRIVSFHTLNIALIRDEQEPESTVLLEKYLVAFGISSLSVSEMPQEALDAIFCPIGSEKLERLFQQKIPVVALQKNMIHDDPKSPVFGILREPFLPGSIRSLLVQLIDRRYAEKADLGSL